MIRTEDVCAFALGKIFRYKSEEAVALMECLDGAAPVFSMTKDELEAIAGPYSVLPAAIRSVNLDREAGQLEDILRRCNCSFLPFTSPSYPALLKECPDAPPGLFVRAADSLGNIFGRSFVSVVGTRDASAYGTTWCGRIVGALSESRTRPTIVSGLAYGIDIASHKAALECSLPTIAVLGTGIDKIYPARHCGYAQSIMERPCSAVVSELPPGSDVQPINFLRRNRIIAGISEATCLVESRIKGGGMATARQAASYDRMVFALPGRNDDLRSQGCNQLIHEQIAEPLIGCAEMLQSLGYKRSRTGAKRSCRDFYAGSLDPCRIAVLDRIISAVKRNPGASLPELEAMLEMAPAELTAAATLLESDGFITIDVLQRCSASRNI